MNFNTILYRLGIDPSNFVNEDNEPIKTPDGFIYEVTQRTNERICPYCGCVEAIINDHDIVEINCSETDQIKDILRIKKVRFKCKGCNKTYTPPITGIDRYSKTSNQTLNMIIRDFTKMITFKDIGIRYGLTTARILQLFDEKINFVPRRTLPFVLCIDEIKFDEEYDQKFCCVLYDHNSKEIVDIIKNRKLAYLEEYFSSIPEKERNNVKYFVSDMYDGYKTVCHKYFRKAIHIVDLFHVINQLTYAVNKIRVLTMNRIGKGNLEYYFMKSKWEHFLCRKEKIPNKLYESKVTKSTYKYDDLVFRCVLKDSDLLEAYNILQDFYHYNEYFYTFTEALDFVDRMVERLNLTGNEYLIDVAHTYKKWRIEIANGLAKSQSGKHYNNGIAEALNNHLKTIIKMAYGYHNFDRFRRRAMLIRTYKKDLE